MSKIICDVCGTMYPETAAQCPICGCAKKENSEAAVSDTAQETTGTYTYVKGGRFSKKNVRKRNKANQKAERAVRVQSHEEAAPAHVEEVPVVEEPKSNRGLVITAIVLLLAIVAVVIYIALRFFVPVGTDKTENTAVSTTQTTAAAVSEETTVACTRLQLNDTTVELTTEGQSWLLNVVPVPEDTTDEITYVSSDESVVMVNGEGRLTAISSGEATITITCGTATAECAVVCNFGEKETEAAEATEETTEATQTVKETVDPDANYSVLFFGEWREDNDVTVSAGDSVEVTLEDDAGNEADVTWKTDETDVVSIDGTTFKALSAGIAYVTAELGGTTYTVIFRVY